MPPTDDPVVAGRGRLEGQGHAAVFLSDFHLSDGTAGGDDFLESHLRPEDEFRGLLTGFFPPGQSRARLVLSTLTLAFRRIAARTGRAELPDVVLDGDVIDFLALKGRGGSYVSRRHLPLFRALAALRGRAGVYWLRGNHDYAVPAGPWDRGEFYVNPALRVLAEHGDRWDETNWPPGPTTKGSRLVMEMGSAFEVRASVADDGTLHYLMAGLDNVRPLSDDAINGFLDRRAKYSDVAAVAAALSRLKFVGSADDSAAYRGARERRKLPAYADWLMVQGHTHVPAAVPGDVLQPGHVDEHAGRPPADGKADRGVPVPHRLPRRRRPAGRGVLRRPPGRRALAAGGHPAVAGHGDRIPQGVRVQGGAGVTRPRPNLAPAPANTTVIPLGPASHYSFGGRSMRRWLLGVSVVLAAAAAAAADDKAEAVIKKAIEAHGGADGLNRYKAARFTMKGEMAIMGMDVEISGDMAYVPDKFRMNINLTVAGQQITVHQVVSGDKGKRTVKVGDQVVQDMKIEKDEVDLSRLGRQVEKLTPLLDAKQFTLRAGDDEDVNGKKAALVIVTPKGLDREFKLYFDKESGLLVKSGHQGKGPGRGRGPGGRLPGVIPVGVQEGERRPGGDQAGRPERRQEVHDAEHERRRAAGEARRLRVQD